MGDERRGEKGGRERTGGKGAEVGRGKEEKGGACTYCMKADPYLAHTTDIQSHLETYHSKYSTMAGR